MFEIVTKPGSGRDETPDLTSLLTPVPVQISLKKQAEAVNARRALVARNRELEA